MEKCAQWGQVIEAYSMTVTGALGSPKASSPSGPGFMRSVRSFLLPVSVKMVSDGFQK